MLKVFIFFLYIAKSQSGKFLEPILIEDLVSQAGPDCGAPKPSATARSHDPIVKWDKQSDGFVRVPYEINPSLTEKSLRAVDFAIEMYNRHTCISIVPKDEDDVNYVEFVGGAECKSEIGKKGNVQEIMLGEICQKGVGNALHEIAHTLGMIHEHNRPDRDQYVEVFTDNVEAGKEDEFEINHHFDSFDKPYDVYSMMHFGSKQFAKEAHLYTILNIDKSFGAGVINSPINSFSDVDIAQLNLMYDCNGANKAIINPSTCYHPSDYGQTYRGDVNFSTVDGQTYECLHWDQLFNSQEYHLQDLKENHCRNVNMMYYDQPMCYIAVVGTSYILPVTCDIDQCNEIEYVTAAPPITTPEPVQTTEEPTDCFWEWDDGDSYRGQVSHVLEGGVVYNCIHWADHLSIEEIELHHLEENYCRTLSHFHQPACLVTVRNGEQYEYVYKICNIPPCEITTEAPEGTTEEPMGTTERQEGTTEEPIGTTEMYEETTEEPMVTTEKQEGTTEQPMGTTEMQEGTTEETMGTTEMQEGTTEEPMGTTEMQEGTTEGLMGTTEKQREVTEEPMGTTEIQEEVTEKPMETTERQEEVTEKVTVTEEGEESENVGDSSVATVVNVSMIVTFALLSLLLQLFY